MLQVSQKKSSIKQSSKLFINPNSSPIYKPNQVLSPVFMRKSDRRRQKLSQSAKSSSNSKSVEKSLKYTKIIVPIKNDITEVRSQVHVFELPATRIDECEDLLHPKSQLIIPLAKKRNHKDSLGKSGVNVSLKQISQKPKIRKPDEHYIYWKNKAHEYLELNMKLMNQVRRLTRQNQELKNLLAENTLKLSRVQKNEDNQNLYSQKVLHREVRNISSIYLSKIDGIERELKRKQTTIAAYELTNREFSIRLAGDRERIKLITKLQTQIIYLKNQLEKLNNTPIVNVLSPAQHSQGFIFEHQ